MTARNGLDWNRWHWTPVTGCQSVRMARIATGGPLGRCAPGQTWPVLALEGPLETRNHGPRYDHMPGMVNGPVVALFRA